MHEVMSGHDVCPFPAEQVRRRGEHVRRRRMRDGYRGRGRHFNGHAIGEQLGRKRVPDQLQCRVERGEISVRVIFTFGGR